MGVLTANELRLLQHVANGGSYKTAAVEMQYAYDTARLFAKTAFAKLGARNKTHAVALALRAGLIT